MHSADNPQALPQNKNAPTPLTRLLPRFQLDFFELITCKHGPRNPCAPPDDPRFTNPGSCPGFLSWPGLLLERTESQNGKNSPTVTRSKGSGDVGGNPRETPGPRGSGSV